MNRGSCASVFSLQLRLDKEYRIEEDAALLVLDVWNDMVDVWLMYGCTMHESHETYSPVSPVGPVGPVGHVPEILHG